MRWVMVVGPLAIAVACGGRSERLIEDEGAGGAADGGDANDTGGSAGKGNGGSGRGGKGGSGGRVSTGGSSGRGGADGGKAGKSGKGGKGGAVGVGGAFPGKGGSAGVGGVGGFGGVAGKAPIAGNPGAGFGGVAGTFGVSGSAGWGGAGAGNAGFAGAAGGGGSGGSANGCSPNPCFNGGVCIPDPSGSVSCNCPSGFSGTRCELPSGPCRVGDEPVMGGCRLQGVCGYAEPATYGSANCSSNTSEFADWWCQLAGYEGAENYRTISADPFEALFYQGKERQVLSECSQVEHTDGYFYGPNCTGVADLICRSAPVSLALRQKVLVCGGSGRSVASFLPAGSPLVVEDGCVPDESTQALLVSRYGTDSVLPEVRAYLHAGGVMLTEYSNSDELFRVVFSPTTAGIYAGSCNDNAPTTVRFNASDPFWLDNPYQVTPNELTGCGFDVSAFPLLVALAGWNDAQVALGYRNLGRGRFWATDFDWSDSDNGQTDYTRSLLGYMITHRRVSVSN